MAAESLLETRGAEIAGWLNRLPFVRWDRLTDWRTPSRDHAGVTVFGWIARDDGRSDFVLMEFFSWNHDPPGFSTSSAERSAEIAELLYGPGGDHFPCQRVEHVFGFLVEHKVELG